MSREHNIDLTDPNVLNEFKKIQRQNIEDIRKIKEGKKPMTDEELKNKLDQEREESYNEAKKNYEQVQKQKDEAVKDIIQNAFNNKEISQKKIEKDI